MYRSVSVLKVLPFDLQPGKNLRDGNHTMSAAIKDATSCCSEEADPSAARVGVQEFLWMGAQA